MNYKVKIVYLFVLCAALTVAQISAQEQNKENIEVKKINFGYSINPAVKSKSENTNSDNETALKVLGIKNEKSAAESPKSSGNETVASTDKTIAVENKVSEDEPADSPQESDGKENVETVARKTLEIVKRANKASLLPTEIYKVGAGDVLFISLQNASSQTAKYYTVLDDGTIDYPLVGKLISVFDLTTDEIEDLLRENVKLFENPQISVKVREHASHRISVFGLVEQPGDKFLQREAIPMYVVKAEVLVKPNAERVIIKRKDSSLEDYALNESKTDEVLVYAGDFLEFTGKVIKTTASNGFYYIGGEIYQGGQMNFHEGITLTQAILAAGGLKNADTKKIIIRRKDETGLLQSETYNLRDIKKGKTPDPLLNIGDTIEVGL